MVLLEAIRRAKADASVSMAAPVAEVTVTAVAGAQTVLSPVIDDIGRMLKVEKFTWVAAAAKDAELQVSCVFAAPAAG